MRPKRYTARALYDEFRKRHPDMWRRGSNAVLIDHMKILIMSPGLGKFTWGWFDDTIVWLEEWVDEKIVKREDDSMRSANYTYLKLLLEGYMKQHEYTQQDISSKTGVSRQSLSKYLSGKAIPKTSTMKKICDALELEL